MPTNAFSFTPAAGAGTQEAQRSSFPPPPLAQTGMAKVLVGLTELGVVGVKPEFIPKLLPPDRMEPALVIMADVRAHFQGSYIHFHSLLFSSVLVTPCSYYSISGIQTICGQCSTRN